MKISLKTKESVFITVVILVISAVSTYLFTSARSRSEERGMLERGAALSYALSKAAAEGLVHEDLDLIKKASNVIRTPDVTLAQVFSDIWEAVDAHPFERLKEPPHPDAVNHFMQAATPLSIKTDKGYDFYSPIFFNISEGSPATGIGFVRISLSSEAAQKELRKAVITNILVAASITLIAILSLHILMGRLVIRPVMKLYDLVTRFRNGVMPEEAAFPGDSSDEIGELSREFYKMCLTIEEKEKSLMESERRIRSLFERVEHAIFRLDAKGEIVEANRRFRDIFGDVNSLCAVIVGDGRAGDCLRRAISEKDMHGEERAVGRSGEELTILLSLYAETDREGKVMGFDGFIIDVTENKRLEERLLRSQKLEAVGTLAGGIAHDFNNLLTAIIGYSEIMIEKVSKDDPLFRYADIIHNAAERGAELTKRILALTRKEKMEMKLLDMNSVIRSSLELLDRSIPKTIEIVTRLGENLPMIKADAAQMQQVILNLAVNARDAMPHEGRLTVETAVSGLHGRAGDGGSADAGFVKISVSDTGIGMDKSTQGKIFDPFFTTKEMGKGTGLGLYMVHSIVTRHGGYINLYSEPGKGTRFNIYLPVAGGEGPEAPAEAVDLRGSETILVVDDEAYIRGMCRDILEPMGYEVLLAESGSEAIDVFGRMGEKISLVILDMIMPRMEGNEVFHALRSIKPGVKVILCSGYSVDGFAGIEQLIKEGAKGFVQKPFTRRNIALAIRKALSE